MTPAEEFAAKRLEAELLIRGHAPQRLQEQLIALLRPAIALTATRTDDEHIPVGASKFGGAPDVPGDFVWPLWNDKPLGFLAQINLEEVAPFDLDGLLPKSGLLLFFQRQDDVTGDQISSVLHFEKDSLGRAIVPQQLAQPDDEIIMVPPGFIEFSPEWTTREFQWSEIPDWDFDQYIDEFVRAFGRVKSVHRMLGNPSLVQDNIFIEAEMEVSGTTYEESQQKESEWVLLLQLDFQEQDCWFSKCYFVIRTEDLPTWSQTRCYYQGD